MKKENNRRKLRLLAVIVCLIIVWPVTRIQAANNVTVATIGAYVPELNKTQGMQNVVEQVIVFWQNKLKQVLPDQPDLIVLPESCDLPRGLSGDERIEYLRVRKNQILDFFASEAKTNHCYIAFGTLHESKEGTWQNSCTIVDRKGDVAGRYYKNFTTIDEMKIGVKAGTRSPLIKCDFGTIGCAICFDMNFDELRRTYAALKPDIIVFPSMYHGGLVQAYWAYSCRSFLVGSMNTNQIPSEIRNPLGEVVATNTNYFDFAVAKINLDNRLVHLDDNGEKLTRLKEKYGKAVIIKDPGKLGSVMVTSEDKNVTVDQMIKEFNIELLDDYFDRSRKFRQDPAHRE